MYVRQPDIQPDQGELVWSKVPEFALASNAYSTVIPHFEYYLNGVIKDVREQHCQNDPTLRVLLDIFIKQEALHARLHQRFNKRMLDENIEGLQALIDRVSADLKQLRASRSLAFNAAYCTGFESIATFSCKYLRQRCDELFEEADPHGANLILWHVAEEFEHRSVCHDAFDAVSGNYFIRVFGLVYAFRHVGGAFMDAERLVIDHYLRDKTEQQREACLKMSNSLFWRQMRYIGPRMLMIFLPGCHPSRLKMPERIRHALEFFKRSGPITERVSFAIGD